MKGAVLFFVGLLAVAYCIALFVFDPSEYSLFPRCPMYWLTGLKCAGCGGQRAVYSLMHGEVLKALRFNCFITVFLPVFAIGVYKGPFAKKKWYPYVGLVVMLIFIVVRNLPGVDL